MAAGTPKRRVVLAMDGSEYADYAFNWYMENFKADGDYLTIVHSFEAKSVAHAALGSDVKALGNVLEEEVKVNKVITDKLQAKLTSSGMTGEVKSVVGKPGEAVVHEAHAQGADVVICGTRGHGKLRRTFMGSVSDYIVHHSHVPVVVCRHKNHHDKHGHRH
ncbi:universal stress protein in QAH/OAS sulfhydrylase 3'region-like [Ostrea edulis]|uniref:universal stress protein in QAH/OAS sulfhydrylase 3'region-like n=1 Tax=Ostrea edulis TaxID=37623 RepID=UPI00209606F1|nr:universal stress protein in QAH/OAS sulfhydrylase 3'region-like [Ostrea edulis]